MYLHITLNFLTRQMLFRKYWCCCDIVWSKKVGKNFQNRKRLWCEVRALVCSTTYWYSQIRWSKCCWISNSSVWQVYSFSITLVGIYFLLTCLNLNSIYIWTALSHLSRLLQRSWWIAPVCLLWSYLPRPLPSSPWVVYFF